MTATIPTAAQRSLLEAYLDELARWNRRLNLTTVPREHAWGRHVVESIRLLDAAAMPLQARCADLGSGGGVPGIPVAVLRPDLRMTLIEADRRKAGFLVHVCGLLGLSTVAVAARRAEELANDPDHRAAYDVVLSRATAPPRRLWDLAHPLLQPAGTLWALVAEPDAAAMTATAAPGIAVDSPARGVLSVTRA